MGLKERLTEIARLNLAQDFTALSYAMMIDGKLWVADAIGTDGSGENRPVTTEHTFNVCSISKVYCTTAVMQLVERGMVELDAPVCGYLPRFTMPEIWVSTLRRPILSPPGFGKYTLPKRASSGPAIITEPLSFAQSLTNSDDSM